MSQTALENILLAIQSLSDEDRELLDKRLSEIDEARWQQEAAEMRRLSQSAGVDQGQIDQTIRKLRYG